MEEEEEEEDLRLFPLSLSLSRSVLRSTDRRASGGAQAGGARLGALRAGAGRQPGPGRHCLPCHGMTINSIIEGFIGGR